MVRRREHLSHRGWFLAVLLAIVAFGNGCNSIRFYSQAIHGQCQILHRQQPIKKVLAQTSTSPELAQQLRRVLAIRSFAEGQLRLPANGHYLTYADLGRRFAVWNVYAAPEFSLEAKSWWYPVVGRLKYQGYFNESAARRLAARLALRHYDVHVGGIQAYSTLGWFHDPVLNTFIADAEVDLAELLIHELAHQRVFIAGDTDFNEAFATMVAEEGVRRWLRAERGPAALAAYETDVRRKHQFIALLSRARVRLASVYAEISDRSGAVNSSVGADHTAQRERKATIFAQLHEEYLAWKAREGVGPDYDGWFTQPLNNARLNTVETYYRLVPAFHQLLAQAGGDLERFYKEVTRLGRLDEEERDRILAQLLPDSANPHR